MGRHLSRVWQTSTDPLQRRDNGAILWKDRNARQTCRCSNESSVPSRALSRNRCFDVALHLC